jgi:hypothetical protein
MDCIPAGMELFPAANEAAWKLIQRVIEESDYYCLIIGGRYGSTDRRGLSFTEREYDYASKVGLPIIAFLHGNPDDIPSGKVDRNEKTAAALKDFRVKVEKNHHCKYWIGPEDLGGKVSRALIQIFKLTPRVGWVRADQVASAKTISDLEKYRRLSEELQQRIDSFEQRPSLTAENLAAGDERVPFNFSYKIHAEDVTSEGTKAEKSTIEILEQIPLTWDEVFVVFGSCILAGDDDWRMDSAIEKKIAEIKRIDADFIKHGGHYIDISHTVMNAFVVQFVAAGLIQTSDTIYRGSNKTVYRLTPRGKQYLLEAGTILAGCERRGS